MVLFFFSSRRRHTRFDCDWSSDVCSSDLADGFRRTCDGFSAASDDDARMPPDQVCDKARQQVVIAVGPAAFDRDIAAHSQPFVAEPANEPGQAARFKGFLRSIAEDTDYGRRRLLVPAPRMA